jgi:hypothetical protein
MSRHRPRYRDNAAWTDIKVCPDIAVSDIVSSRHDIMSFFPISDPILVNRRRYRDNMGTYPFLAKPDITNIVPNIVFSPYISYYIGSISGHTRSLPNPISDFSPISGLIWSRYCKKYRNIRISGQKNLDIVPEVYAISQYTDIVYFQYRAFFLISGTIYHLLRLSPPPAAQALRPLSRRSNRSSLLVLSSADQRGSALGTANILAHSVLLQKKALVSGGATYSKLET